LRVEDWLTAGEMAGVFHMDPRVFRDWARRGWIRVMVSNGKRRYNVGDVVEYSKKRHQRKSACATIGLETPCPETSFG
jgi:predicted site-specific integrase-resolvase